MDSTIDYDLKMERSKKIITIIVTAIISILAVFGIELSVGFPNTTVEKVVEKPVENSSLELSPEQVPAVVEDAQGEEKTDDSIPTVEEVNGGPFELEEESGDVSDAQGAFYRTDTLAHFIEDTQYKCVIEGNRWGAQCVSLAQAFWTNYAGRSVSVCGTGAARGIWVCKEQNAGEDFVLITDARDIQPGDWIVTDGGAYGHVATAVGPYTNGYVAVYGENQGGVACPEGGAQPNVINLSMKKFLGAFRPKIYIKPEPEPEPEPEPAPADPCKRIEVKKGDTLGAIMKRCEGKIVWGKAMDEYAKTWRSVKYKRYATVYDGWVSAKGYGLFAGDIIERD